MFMVDRPGFNADEVALHGYPPAVDFILVRVAAPTPTQEADICRPAADGHPGAKTVSIGSDAYGKQASLASLTAASVQQVRGHLLTTKDVRSCDLLPHVEKGD
jgi:hypothetical protein